LPPRRRLRRDGRTNEGDRRSAAASRPSRRNAHGRQDLDRTVQAAGREHAGRARRRYLDIDASVGQFGPSPLTQLGLQAAEGASGVATVLSEHLASDNEAVVKAADARLGETEQALLFDPQSRYLNWQGHDALTQAPAVLDAYRVAQAPEMATTADDDQQQMLRQLVERRLASFSTVIERRGAAERRRWHDAAGERRIALMRADAALHWSDDALLRRARCDAERGSDPPARGGEVKPSEPRCWRPRLGIAMQAM
jgi:hypothetical protein